MSADTAKQAAEPWSPELPRRTNTQHGEPRRIGVELEFIGLDVATTAGIVAAHLGGTCEEKSRYEQLIHGDLSGDWRVELDYAYLKERGASADLNEADDSDIVEAVEAITENIVRAGAKAVVPVEVVSPPLPMRRLSVVQSLIAQLRAAGAQGTSAGITYAFGMQFNPELPDLQANTISAYLKAFFCLYDWLIERSDPNLTRRLTGFSAAFPNSYLRKVVDCDYWPTQDKLIDDYLADNPTRNRALDMLPLFLHLDHDRLRAVVDDPRVKPRPTLHYRLPNCEIDDEAWGVHTAWDHWLRVEALAADGPRLATVCAAYSNWLDKPLERLFESWASEVSQWVAT